MNKTQNNQKVFVGLSGGVDSSVSALLLKNSGYDVTGVFIKAWHPDFLPCNWRGEMRDAMRICAKLKIPFLLCDLEKEYKTEVIDYLIDGYKKGLTPNPDVFCNKEIKFGHFLNWSIEKGADYIATGHYARTVCDESGCRMLSGCDSNKDQTYFLWTITEDKLTKILFPIGDIKKPKVRKIAEKYNLHTAGKKDSQGLCFVGHVDMKLFLKRFIDTAQGPILNTQGEIIGEHYGAELYTLGQRHGFTINENDSERKNYYIIDKNLDRNEIIVDNKQSIVNNSQTGIVLNSVSFTKDSLFELEEIELEIKPRYRSKNYQARLIKNNSEYILKTTEEIEKIAKGQSVVFYKGEECLGGGIVT
jgi:tRNA-specific 2-thiouridylase